MEMRDCPNYNNCSVPICPLDPDWEKRTMLDNEGVCPFALESVKPGGRERFTEYGHDVMWPIATGPVAQAQAQKHIRIQYGRERAVTTGSTWDRNRASGQRLVKARTE
jgi:hypothetical protein